MKINKCSSAGKLAKATVRPDDLTETRVVPSKISNRHSQNSQNEKFNEAEESNFAEPTRVGDKPSSFAQNGIFCFRIGPGTFGRVLLLSLIHI